jgi:YD repeat-containing protein
MSGTFTMLQNVVLPNGTMWSFSYNSHGDLASITFPTGNTITYEWANIRFCSGTSRALTSRTVTDATGPHKWSYVWSPGVWTNFNLPPPPTTVTVTDPELNDSVHVSTPMGACSYYETHGEYYQGSQQSGTLLKKVDTAYITFADPMDEYVQSSNVGVFPTTTTTTWANGSVNKEQIDSAPLTCPRFPHSDFTTQPVAAGAMGKWKTPWVFSKRAVRASFP